MVKVCPAAGRMPALVPMTIAVHCTLAVVPITLPCGKLDPDQLGRGSRALRSWTSCCFPTMVFCSIPGLHRMTCTLSSASQLQKGHNSGLLPKSRVESRLTVSVHLEGFRHSLTSSWDQDSDPIAALIISLGLFAPHTNVCSVRAGPQVSYSP
jgi:hypothetical protein